MNWLSLEKQVVGKRRQGWGKVGEGGSNMGRRRKMGRGAEWKVLYLHFKVLFLSYFRELRKREGAWS